MVSCRSAVVLFVLLSSLFCFGQMPSAPCDSSDLLVDCASLTESQSVQRPTFGPVPAPSSNAEIEGSSEISTDAPNPGRSVVSSESFQPEHFHWGPALKESFMFLVIEQAWVVHTDFNWVVIENGIPFNHYWRDYTQSMSSWWRAGWSAGEDPLYNYVGHPIQGALTSYIEIQNDPKNERLEFANTKAYWLSRLKATIWNTVYSTQWSIGPLSEMTVEKYGAKARPPWNANGSFPCDTKTCYSGVGKVNLVMTPVGGLGWMLTEDILDKKIAEQLVEKHTGNRFLIDSVRCALNPIRGGANILHGHHPWYRVSRDGQEMPLVSQKTTTSPADAPPESQPPTHGDVLLGYTHTGPSHCEQPFSGATLVCDPVSTKASKLAGWNVAVEKKYLRYFGVVADFSGQYGGISQNNFLFGARGGASIERVHPFAQVLFGAVHVHQTGSPTLNSETSFAEDLGMGADFRLLRRLSWRNQVDEIKTGAPNFERRNLRLSSGVAIGF